MADLILSINMMYFQDLARELVSSPTSSIKVQLLLLHLPEPFFAKWACVADLGPFQNASHTETASKDRLLEAESSRVLMPMYRPPMHWYHQSVRTSSPMVTAIKLSNFTQIFFLAYSAFVVGLCAFFLHSLLVDLVCSSSIGHNLPQLFGPPA